MLFLQLCENSVKAEIREAPSISVGEGGGTGKIAYCYQPNTGSIPKEIYLIHVDGTGNTKISNAVIGLNHHHWSPDARKIAAVGYVNTATWSTYVFDSDGSNLIRLTTVENVWDGEPYWSPAGTKIAFTRIYPNQGYRNELWVMDADGSNQHWIGREGFAAKWSPDGAQFIYQANRDGDVDIFTCNIDGTDEQQVTFTTSNERTPIWSPDGSQIAFTSDRDGNAELYVMDADGANPYRLTYNSVGDYTPKWSPDGTLIAFDSGLPGDDHWEVYVINADGTNLRRVTYTPSDATAINPDWQPWYCDCGVWGDVTGDGLANPVDVVYMVNFVYKGLDSRVPPPSCPYEQGDADCTGQVNPVDVVYFVNLVYKGQNAFCDPCF